MRNCLVINLDRCSGCDSCVVACKFANNLDLGVRWNTVAPIGSTGTFPDIEQYWLPSQCQQCENAPCIDVCPTGASYRDEGRGLVLVNPETCIGCQLCMSACPFDARFYNESSGVVEKCTCCIDWLERGENPACVHSCCCGARLYGDLDDPESDVAKAVAAAGEEGCHHLSDPDEAGPLTVYILSTDVAAWRS